MQTAFKEWAIVVGALGRGEQIVILRKGGIAEGRGGFKPEHPEFWLFPTRFHQQRECVIETAQQRYDAVSGQWPPPEQVVIEFHARIVAWKQLEDLSMAQRLRGQHIWRDEVIANRFDWGREKNLWAMAVRVFRLPQPVLLPMLPAYGGCKSWIELDPGLAPAGAPVLAEDAFERKLRAFGDALGMAAPQAANAQS